MIITNEHLKSAVKAIQESFHVEEGMCKEPYSLLIHAEDIVDVVRLLRDEYRFNFLSDITASDYWPEEEPRMHIVYNLYSLPENVRICLRVPLNGDGLVIHTIENLFPNANWHERELWDMFGVHIDGHSDLRRILMPYDWEGHPLRKDYPLGYEEPQFTFNYDDIDRRKHKAGYEEA
jgi:NADH-quinone oxidoreductase subunit C